MNYVVVMNALVMLKKEVDRRRHMDGFNFFGPFHENSSGLIATKADKEWLEINISVCQAQCSCNPCEFDATRMHFIGTPSARIETWRP